MKKLIFLTTLLFGIITSYGQHIQETSNTSSLFSTLTHKGNFILGDLQSTSTLNPFQIYSSNPNKSFAMVLGNASGRWEFAVAGGNGSYAPKAKKGWGVIRRIGNHNMIFSMPNDNRVVPNYDTTNYNSSGITSISFSDSVNHNSLVIYNTGKVTMGTEKYDNDNDYRLYVKDGIKTERIKVEIASSNGWADYVFDNDYKLRSLEEVEQYITENKHLPEIPSTSEVLKNGIELKEMNVLLLKKVEELTLYLLEQNKKIKELTERVDELKN
jgi:hypothetical protein